MGAITTATRTARPITTAGLGTLSTPLPAVTLATLPVPSN